MGRKKKLENQSELIIEAARQLFSQFGFAKTTLDDIAREVGIGKATLYSDFSSKDDILQAVIHKNQQQALENMRAVIKKSKFGPLKTLHELLLQDVMFTYEQMKRHFQDTDPSRPPILQGGRIVSTAPYQNTMDEKARIMAELLDQAIRDGLIEPMPDTVAQARIFRLGLMGVKPLVMTGYKDHEVRQHISNLIDILLSGLKVPRNKLDEPLGKQWSAEHFDGSNLVRPIAPTGLEYPKGTLAQLNYHFTGLGLSGHIDRTSYITRCLRGGWVGAREFFQHAQHEGAGIEAA